MKTYLTLILENEDFAVPVINVLEVLEKQIITPIPLSPVQLQGIINFRGNILPVINSRIKFNLPMADNIKNQVIIVYELTKPDNTKIQIAATADAVNDVITVKDHEIKPIPESGNNFDVNFVTGIVLRNNVFIMLLNINNIFLNNQVN